MTLVTTILPARGDLLVVIFFSRGGLVVVDAVAGGGDCPTAADLGDEVVFAAFGELLVVAAVGVLDTLT